MKRILIAVAAVVLLLAAAQADQYSCQTVDQSAVAYVTTNVAVSKLETQGRCVLSIDGAVATGDRASSFEGEMNALVYEFFQSESRGVLHPDSFVDLLTSPFGLESRTPDAQALIDSVAANVTPEDITAVEDCLNSFADMLGAPNSGYSGIQDIGVFQTEHVYCYAIMPSGDLVPEPGWTMLQNGTFYVEFKFDETALSLALPTQLLVTARDGKAVLNELDPEGSPL